MPGMHKYHAKIAFNLHFISQRSFVTIFMPLLFCVSTLRPGSGHVLTHCSPDSLRGETIQATTPFPGFTFLLTLLQTGNLSISPDAVDLPIVYNAEGYMKTDLKTKKVSLVQNAQVNYGTIELTADSIVLDMETGSVYATGRIDSTGKMAGKPAFQGRIGRV